MLESYCKAQELFARCRAPWKDCCTRLHQTQAKTSPKIPGMLVNIGKYSAVCRPATGFCWVFSATSWHIFSLVVLKLLELLLFLLLLLLLLVLVAAPTCRNRRTVVAVSLWREEEFRESTRKRPGAKQRQRKARALFEKNAAPILHLSGMDVTVVKTDYEGQAKKLLELMENTDVIIVAGGDGTLQESKEDFMNICIEPDTVSKGDSISIGELRAPSASTARSMKPCLWR
ncbi:uncharacterized protein LOC121463352 [Microtus oregoni]|uniref:uncharacterized protein LOC121463352 n=1 Tax=Microtus oregoni TaxID=111838 RepID=UPI001BB162A7|nr:uncharacterized protein LOC121463352 [Microtus oregoni]